MTTQQHGLTIIELLLVIGIIALIATASTPFISSFILRNNYETTVDKVVSTIRKAQQYSLDGKNASVWGFCLSGNAIRLFSSSCAAPSFAEDFAIPASVSISGLSETTFSPLRGEPSNAVTITISTAIGIQTVVVNAAGGMEIN